MKICKQHWYQKWSIKRLLGGGVTFPSSSVSVSGAPSLSSSMLLSSSLAMSSAANLGWSYLPPSFFFMREWKSIFDNLQSWIKKFWSANIAHNFSVPKRKFFLQRKRKCSGSQNNAMIKKNKLCWWVVIANSMFIMDGRGGKSPPPLALQVGGKSPWGEKSPPIWHCEGGEKSPPGKISLPLKNIFTKSAWTFFTCTAHEFDFNPTLLHSYILNLERSQTSKNMFLTIKIEKI